RAPIGVLPVVARAMVEPRIRARRDRPEGRLVGDVDDPDLGHAGPPESGVPATRSTSVPSWTIRVTAARSGPGSRSPSSGATTARIRACASATPSPGAGPDAPP